MFCAFTRPRYQVRVYRTIGPLVLYLLPWVDLDLFFGNAKFNKLGFYIEKCDSDGFFGNYCSLWTGNWLIYLRSK